MSFYCNFNSRFIINYHVFLQIANVLSYIACLAMAKMWSESYCDCTFKKKNTKSITCSYAHSVTLCSVNFPNAKWNGRGIIAVGNYFQSDVLLHSLSHSARWVTICLWYIPMDGWQSTTYLSPPYKSAVERTSSHWKAMWSLLPFPVFSIGWNIGVFIDIDMFRKTIKVTSKLHQSSAKNLLLKDFFSFPRQIAEHHTESREVCHRIIYQK